MSRLLRAWVSAAAAVAALAALAPSQAGAADRNARAAELVVDAPALGTAPVQRGPDRIAAGGGVTMGRLVGDLAAGRPLLLR